MAGQRSAVQDNDVHGMSCRRKAEPSQCTVMRIGQRWRSITWRVHEQVRMEEPFRRRAVAARTGWSGQAFVRIRRTPVMTCGDERRPPEPCHHWLLGWPSRTSPRGEAGSTPPSAGWEASMARSSELHHARSLFRWPIGVFNLKIGEGPGRACRDRERPGARGLKARAPRERRRVAGPAFDRVVRRCRWVPTRSGLGRETSGAMASGYHARRPSGPKSRRSSRGRMGHESSPQTGTTRRGAPDHE